MRDLMVLGAMIFLIPLSFRGVYPAYLLWAWASLASLNSLLYGFMSFVPFVQVFALISIFQYFTKNDNQVLKFELNRTVVLFIIFAIHSFFSAIFAYPDLYRNWELCSNLLKALFFCILMPMIVTTRFRVYAMLLVIVVAGSFHGLMDGLKFLASGGAHQAIGNAKLGDNNHFAVLMAMLLPIIFYLYRYSAVKVTKITFFFIFIIVVLSVISTKSRGGLICLSVMAIWLLLLSKQKARGVVFLVAVSFLALSLAPDSWNERMNTIRSAEQDGSFMGRVTAWKRASAIAVENPIFGGGFHAGQAPQIFPDFRYKQGLLGFVETPDVGYPAASHSIYFEVLGDLGFVGLALFVGILFNALMTRNRIVRASKNIKQDTRWIVNLSNLLAGSVIAYAVGGAALSAAYFDFPYIIFMLMEVLWQLITKIKSSEIANT